MLRRSLSKFIRRHSVLSAPLRLYRAHQLETRYADLCCHYRSQAQQRGITYDESIISDRILNKLGNRCPVRPKEYGEIHTFFIDNNHEYTVRQMQPAFRRIGHLRTIDWQKETGISSLSPKWVSHARHANNILARKVREIHDSEGLDLVFIASRPGTVLPETLKIFRDIGLPTATLWFDDIHSFHQHMQGRIGDCPMADLIDLHWTSTLECCIWYIVEGAIPIYLAEGADPEIYRPKPSEFKYDVCFIGQRYGFRGDFVDRLIKEGINVACWGNGWPARMNASGGFLFLEKIAQIYNQSKIVLGVGGVLDSKKLVCLKGRDFEVPMSGALYLTSFNSELADWYRIGEEILCYNNFDDCIETIRNMLANPSKSASIREASAARAQREHTWDNRFSVILRTMGILKNSSPSASS